MPMNKKERAEVAELKRQLAEAKAWRRTEKVEPDVPVPTVSGQISRGFSARGNVSVHASARHAASDSVSHIASDCKQRIESWARDPWGSGIFGSQQGIPLYSKLSLALRAVRHMLEEDMAYELAKLDRRIAEAEQEEAAAQAEEGQ